jgi:hypothetical protein
LEFRDRGGGFPASCCTAPITAASSSTLLVVSPILPRAASAAGESHPGSREINSRSDATPSIVVSSSPSSNAMEPNAPTFHESMSLSSIGQDSPLVSRQR